MQIKNMKKVISKGYTLEVISWENDGDNYRTKYNTIQDREKAAAVVKACKELFCSCNNGEGGIGNICEGEESVAERRILDWVEENPSILPKNSMSEQSIIDYIMDFNHDLMGGTEWYYSRVCESVNVTFSEEDVYLQEVEL